MPPFLVELIRHLHPAGERWQVLNRFQRRALAPTWPVAMSLIILAAAVLFADQGRAIVRYTSSEFGRDLDSLFTWTFLTLHGVLVMYTTFLLSVVTRRNFLDTPDNGPDGLPPDPVDPSISLRLAFSYVCGVSLPLLFMGMALWFQFGLIHSDILCGLAIGIAASILYLIFAHLAFPSASRALARSYYNANSSGFVSSAISRPAFRLVRVLTHPRRRFAQVLIVCLLFVFAWLTLWSGQERDELLGPLAFFASFLAIHSVFRLFTERFVRLHQGHVARYIVIDKRFDTGFRWVRRFLLVAIPAAFWSGEFVEFLGPLNVGLFGTLWIALFLSGLVESAARQSDPSNPHRSREALAATNSEISQSVKPTARSWFFLVLLVLLGIEILIWLGEILRFELSQGQLVMTLALLVISITGVWSILKLKRSLFGNEADFVRRLNTLPTVFVLSPILLLSMGEAHHLHRLETGQTNSGPQQVLSMNNHAKRWLEHRISMRSEAESEAIPVIVVLAEGGGIRAAAHAGYYLNELDQHIRNTCENSPSAEICWRRKDTRLVDNTFVISGVSGGAIGSATYLAALYEENQASSWDDCNEHEDSCRHRFREKVIHETVAADHLSSLLSGMFGLDLFSAVLPVQMPDRIFALWADDISETDFLSQHVPGRWMLDRADVFERRLAETFSNARDNERGTDGPVVTHTFDLPLERVARGSVGADSDDPGPVVMFSTFSETQSKLMAAANVDILKSGQDGRCGTVPIVQQVFENANFNLGVCNKRRNTLALSSAAHISARFPVFNPTAIVETRNREGAWSRNAFVDGGYLDNSGALAAREAIEALKKAATDKSIDVPIKVFVVHLFAMPIVPHQIVGDFGSFSDRADRQRELSTIPSAVLKARSVSGNSPILLLCESLEGSAEQCERVLDARRANQSGGPNSSYTNERYDQRFNKGVPTDASAFERIPVFETSVRISAVAGEAEPNSQGGLTESIWLPMPLEIATTSRQENATEALLGWTLPGEMSGDLQKVACGAAKLTSAQLFATGPLAAGRSCQRD